MHLEVDHVVNAIGLVGAAKVAAEAVSPDVEQQQRRLLPIYMMISQILE